MSNQNEYIFSQALEKYITQVDPFVNKDKAKLLSIQNDKSSQLLSFCKDNVPLWSQNEIDDIKMDRELVSNNFNALVSSNEVHFSAVHSHYSRNAENLLLRKYQVFLSAGRSGKLTYFVYDEEMWVTYLSAILRMFHLAGVSNVLKERIAFVGTSDKNHTLYRVWQSFPKKYSFICGLQEGVDACLKELNEFQPTILYGFSSAINLFAEEQLDNRLSIKPKWVFPNTDYLSTEMRNTIFDVWKPQIHVSYGTTEMGIIGAEDKYGQFLLYSDHVKLEESQKVIRATNLTNRIQPFVNYHMPDGISTAKGGSRNSLDRLILKDGRVNQILKIPGIDRNQIKVHPIFFRSILDRIPNIESSKVSMTDGTLLLGVKGDISENNIISAVHAKLRLINCDMSKFDIVLIPLK